MFIQIHFVVHTADVHVCGCFWWCSRCSSKRICTNYTIILSFI